MTWAQVDAWAEAAAHPVGIAKGTTEWRAFAKVDDGTLWGKLRFRMKPSDPRRIKVEHPCNFVPGKWRSHGFVLVSQLVPDAEREAARAAAEGKKAPLLTPARARAVLVAIDAWQMAGCPRMSRPKVIP